MTAPISGKTRRYVSKSPRIATEVFEVEFDNHPVEPIASDDDPGILVDEYRFTSQSPEGATLIYRRDWGAEADRDRLVANRFSGNTNVEQRPKSPRLVDASDYAPLEDDQFWRVIGFLGGRTSHRALDEAAAQLAVRNDEFILRFAQAASLKMWQLDSPGLCSTALMPDGTPFLDAGTSRALRGAAIAGGQSVFEAGLLDPGSMLDLTLTDNSWSVPNLAEAAWTIKNGDVFIETHWSSTPGSNAALWTDEPLLPLEDTAFEELDPYVPGDGLPQHIIDLMTEMGISYTQEPPWFLPMGTWWLARFLVISARRLDECLLLIPVIQSEISWDAVGRAVEEFATQDGSTLASGIDIWNTHSQLLASGEIFSIRRRSSLKLDAYIESFTPPR